MVHRTMPQVPTPSRPAVGGGGRALDEHAEIVRAIEARDGAAAEAAIRRHISVAFETRLKLDAERHGA
jgi:DNA-binding GntR family transcriptional regulator